jgi:hypothetical protein
MKISLLRRDAQPSMSEPGDTGWNAGRHTDDVSVDGTLSLPDSTWRAFRGREASTGSKDVSTNCAKGLAPPALMCRMVCGRMAPGPRDGYRVEDRFDGVARLR